MKITKDDKLLKQNPTIFDIIFDQSDSEQDIKYIKQQLSKLNKKDELTSSEEYRQANKHKYCIVYTTRSGYTGSNYYYVLLIDDMEKLLLLS